MNSIQNMKTAGSLSEDQPGTHQNSIVPAAAEQAITVVTIDSAEATVEHWIQTINNSLRHSAGWLILTGDNLNKAKAQLGHGRWLTMFGASKLKFSVRTAQRLMEIAANQALANATSWSCLPPTPSVLNYLSHVDPQALQKGMEDGRIHPRMSLKDAKAFTATAQQKQLPLARQRKPFDPNKRRERLARQIIAETERWPVDQRTTLAHALRELADKIAAA